MSGFIIGENLIWQFFYDSAKLKSLPNFHAIRYVLFSGNIAIVFDHNKKDELANLILMFGNVRMYNLSYSSLCIMENNVHYYPLYVMSTSSKKSAYILKPHGGGCGHYCNKHTFFIFNVCMNNLSI